MECYLPKFDIALKIGLPNRKGLIFQPSFFKGYVKLQVGIWTLFWTFFETDRSCVTFTKATGNAFIHLAASQFLVPNQIFLRKKTLRCKEVELGELSPCSKLSKRNFSTPDLTEKTTSYNRFWLNVDFSTEKKTPPALHSVALQVRVDVLLTTNDLFFAPAFQGQTSWLS